MIAIVLFFRSVFRVSLLPCAIVIRIPSVIVGGTSTAIASTIVSRYSRAIVSYPFAQFAHTVCRDDSAL